MNTLPELLRELVATSSVSGTEGPIADLVHGWLRARGIECERLGDDLIARLGRAPGPRLLFNSHLDTVPLGEGWTQPPLGAPWREGRLYGRGSNDAKASVAAMLWMLARLAERPRQLPAGELLVALTTKEETVNEGMGRVLAHLGLPDGGVTGEPTGLQVVRAQAGLAVLKATWTGRSCHAAHVARVPHDNALLKAAADMGRTAPYLTLAPEHPLLGASTIAPTVLHAGERHNVVPDHAEALFDARLAPPHTGADAAALLAERMRSAHVVVRSARLQPIETAADHPLVLAALAVAGRAAAVGSTTLSDMALLQGVPAVKVGPGETARSHTPDEYVLRTELEAGAAFYEALAPAALEALAAARAAGGSRSLR